MRIIFLNPPFLPKFSRSQRSPAVTKSGTLYYPYWLAYATGVAEQAGFECKLIDAPAKPLSMQDVLAQAQEFQPRLIVVDTATASIHNDVKVAAVLKEALPEAFTVLVGTHVSAVAEATLKLNSRIDAVARKEYDYTIRDLAATLEGKGDLSSVLGLTYRVDGEIFHNPDRPYIDNLDEIPWVSRVYKRHLRIEDYFYASIKWPLCVFITGRGCPYHCTFCVYPQVMTGHKYRLRSIEDVVEEMEYVKKELPQVREIFFEDDTLTVNKKRVRAMCELILKKNLKMSWSCNSRADVDYETLRMMRRAGARLLCVGFESGDQQILDNVKKRLKVERSKRFMKDSRRAGILVHGCFIAGNPGETKESLQKTLKLALELTPYTAQFFPIMVYPGTEAYRWYEERGCLTAEDYSQWLTGDGFHNTVVRTPDFTSKELVDFCDEARRKFYFRPKYIFSLLRQALSHPAEVISVLKAFRASIWVLISGSFQRALIRPARHLEANSQASCNYSAFPHPQPLSHPAGEGSGDIDCRSAPCPLSQSLGRGGQGVRAE